MAAVQREVSDFDGRNGGACQVNIVLVFTPSEFSFDEVFEPMRAGRLDLRAAEDENSRGTPGTTASRLERYRRARRGG